MIDRYQLYDLGIKMMVVGLLLLPILGLLSLVASQ